MWGKWKDNCFFMDCVVENVYIEFSFVKYNDSFVVFIRKGRLR